MNTVGYIDSLLISASEKKSIKIGKNEIPTNLPDFFFDVIRRSYGEKIKEEIYLKAYEKEKELVQKIVHPEYYAEQIINNNIKDEIEFRFLQLLDLESHAYFLGLEKNRPVTIIEASEDYFNNECENNQNCSNCDNICCYSKAYRLHFILDKKGTLVYHSLLHLRNEKISHLEKIYGEKYEDCSRMFVEDSCINTKEGKRTRAELFYENFQNGAMKVIEEKYLMAKAQYISSLMSGQDANQTELCEIVNEFVSNF